MDAFRLELRQQPQHSRMCGLGDKVDRRPIDPPPIIVPCANAAAARAHRLPVLPALLPVRRPRVPAVGSRAAFIARRQDPRNRRRPRVVAVPPQGLAHHRRSLHVTQAPSLSFPTSACAAKARTDCTFRCSRYRG